MGAGADGDVGEGVGIDMPEVQAVFTARGGGVERQFHHLIEVAVEDFTEPGDVDSIATHQAIDGAGIEGFA